jgi:hypothetical protein
VFRFRIQCSVQKDSRGIGNISPRFKNPGPTSSEEPKTVVTNKSVKRMVLGSDIGLEDTCRMALCGLVGRFTYSNLCEEKFSVWLERVWLPVLGYIPEVYFLTKGWIGFICNCPEDVATLLGKNWVNGTSSLMLKRWRVAFNPETKYFSLRHMWVLLPGLPLYLWNEGALAAIGNSLGKFIMIDKGNLRRQLEKLEGCWLKWTFIWVCQRL